MSNSPPCRVKSISRAGLNTIELLKSRDIGFVGAGGHDSSNKVIEEFKNAFGPKYRYIEVGQVA